ncbi:MAG: hypothetical protein F4X57_04285 [Chloroflexi bacterium]|nr:hypothetical protein [Chloroflexota bacterium]
MSRVDIYRLETGHTYQIIRSKKDTDLLDYVHDDSGTTRTYLLPRPSIFAQRQPPKVDSWEELLEYQAPRGEIAPRKWMVFAHGDDGIALGLNGPLTKPERQNLLDSVELVSVQRAQSAASKTDAAQNRLMSMAMTAIIGIAVVLALVICLVGISGYLGRDDAPVDAVQTEQDVGPPPTPGPTPEDWQNPRPAP